jgi:hypothetical protein
MPTDYTAYRSREIRHGDCLSSPNLSWGRLPTRCRYPCASCTPASQLDDDFRPHHRGVDCVYQGRDFGICRDVHPTANNRDSSRQANVAERASDNYAERQEFYEVRFGESRHTLSSGDATPSGRAARKPRQASRSPVMVYTS